MFNSANTQDMPVSGQLDQYQSPTACQFVDWQLRCQILEIEWRIEVLRSQEYSRLLLGENHHRALPPTLPAPEGGSQSVAQVALPRPPVLAPVPQPDDVRTGYHGGTVATPQRRLIDAGPSHSAHDDTESQATPARTRVYNRRRSGERGEPQHGREPVPGRFHPYMTSPVISHPRIQSSQASGGPRSGPLGAGVEGVPAPSLRSVGNRRFCSHDSVKSFFHEEDLDMSPLTPQDHLLAWMTPDVKSTRFTALFGGNPKDERPRSRLCDILCVNPEAQPYAPTLPGETGLLIVMPNTVLLEDNCNAFHIFINLSPPSAPNVECSFRYFGTYTKVPVTRTTLEPDEWRSLPPRCRTLWAWRILSSTVPNVRNILARMCIRTERPNGPPPSPTEINNWLESNPRRYEGTKQRIVDAALDSGEEKIEFELVKCIRYDLGVVRKLQTCRPTSAYDKSTKTRFPSSNSKCHTLLLVLYATQFLTLADYQTENVS